jgi:hypothetical protein
MRRADGKQDGCVTNSVLERWVQHRKRLSCPGIQKVNNVKSTGWKCSAYINARLLQIGPLRAKTRQPGNGQWPWQNGRGKPMRWISVSSRWVPTKADQPA